VPEIIELTRPLPVSAFVTHAEAGPGVDVNLFTEDGVARFSDMFRQSINQLLKTSEASADEFAVETLNYPYAYIWPVVDELGLSVTLDVGHLEFYGFPLEEHLKDYLNRTRVLHVHGVREGKDHNSLVWYPSGSMDALLAALQAAPDSDRVFTMEIFSLDDFESSSALMHERGEDCEEDGVCDRGSQKREKFVCAQSRFRVSVAGFSGYGTGV